MKRLTLFENQEAYDAAKYGLDYPNVSVLTASPNTPIYVNEAPTPSHEFVEIGGVKWATMNVGATGITDYGLYFQWGGTQGYTADQCGSGEGQKYFGWTDTPYYTGDTGSGSSGFTKYNSSTGLTTLEAVDDAVTANWGGDWRMPTTAEYAALGNATTSAWTTNYQESGKAGLVLTSTADTNVKLFFPAAGYCSNGGVYNVGSNGYYWSSSLNTSNVVFGYGLSFNSSNVRWQLNYYRFSGFAVRGVFGENSSN